MDLPEPPNIDPAGLAAADPPNNEPPEVDAGAAVTALPPNAGAED